MLGNISKKFLLLLLEALTSESFSLQSLSYSSNRQGFTKVTITRAGCLREWSQGELLL